MIISTSFIQADPAFPQGKVPKGHARARFWSFYFSSNVKDGKIRQLETTAGSFRSINLDQVVHKSFYAVHWIPKNKHMTPMRSAKVQKNGIPFCFCFHNGLVFCVSGKYI